MNQHPLCLRSVTLKCVLLVRKEPLLSLPLIWPHKRHSLCYDVSLLYLYITILRDMHKLDMNYSEFVTNRRQHTFQYGPRNRTVDSNETKRYNMEKWGREGQPLPQRTHFNSLCDSLKHTSKYILQIIIIIITIIIVLPYTDRKLSAIKADRRPKL